MKRKNALNLTNRKDNNNKNTEIKEKIKESSTNNENKIQSIRMNINQIVANKDSKENRKIKISKGKKIISKTIRNNQGKMN